MNTLVRITRQWTVISMFFFRTDIKADVNLHVVGWIKKHTGTVEIVIRMAGMMLGISQATSSVDIADNASSQAAHSTANNGTPIIITVFAIVSGASEFRTSRWTEISILLLLLFIIIIIIIITSSTSVQHARGTPH